MVPDPRAHTPTEIRKMLDWQKANQGLVATRAPAMRKTQKKLAKVAAAKKLVDLTGGRPLADIRAGRAARAAKARADRERFQRAEETQIDELGQAAAELEQSKAEARALKLVVAELQRKPAATPSDPKLAAEVAELRANQQEMRDMLSSLLDHAIASKAAPAASAELQPKAKK